MTPSGQTICLCMIVKDEAPVIRRCLASVRSIIDHWLIVDTGSTDGTQDVIRAAMRELPGELVERPWVDFGTNRSEALALARPRADYALIIDADDEFVVPPDFAMPVLDADSYQVDIVYGPIRYQRTQLVRNALAWRYRGVLHEFPECLDAKTVGHLPLLMRINHEGRRSTDPQTYAKDAAVLETALATETDPFLVSRYTFYLGQSFRDCGQPEKALDAYLRRADLGFWEEEVYVSLYQAGRMMETLGHAPDTVLATYARASAAVPSRAEAAHAAARLCRGLGRNAEGCTVAEPALGLPVPAAGLFVEPWIYGYGLYDEYAVNAYWAGRYRACIDGCLRALQSGTVPPADQPRFLANMRFSLDKLPYEEAGPRSIREGEAPRVLVAVLAKQKETVLPLYLRCLEALDYPKSAIVLYVRTNNNTDRTAEILRAWIDRVGKDYAAVEFDASDSGEPVERFGVHEWNATRFKVLAEIRNESLRRTSAHACDFYFVADVDNFLAPSTLKDLVRLDLPIVAPMLRHVEATSLYSNFHAAVDRDGYFAETPFYDALLRRTTVGPVVVPVVHCTYLIRADQLPRLRYDDASGRHEYVVFSETARTMGIPQYLDNRRDYGLLTLDDDKPEVIPGQLAAIARALGMAPSGAEEQVREAFEAIYQENVWTYGSGPGSLPINTVEYRGFLERFIEANAIKSVTDLGCGDWQSTRQIDWSGVSYTGFDVVQSVVDNNRARHSADTVAFRPFTSIDDLPGGDLLICKEVLQHLPNATVDAYVAAIRRKYRFALLTNSTEPGDLANRDIDAGGFRPLRLDEAPFSIPGAKVFTYFPQSGSHLWKNVVFLVMGSR